MRLKFSNHKVIVSNRYLIEKGVEALNHFTLFLSASAFMDIRLVGSPRSYCRRGYIGMCPLAESGVLEARLRAFQRKILKSIFKV